MKKETLYLDTSETVVELSRKR